MNGYNLIFIKDGTSISIKIGQDYIATNNMKIENDTVAAINANKTICQLELC